MDQKWIRINNNEGTRKTEGQQISVTDEDLEKRLHAKMKEFNSKIEMGRKLKLLVDKNRYNVNGLDNDMIEALKIYKLHG